MVTRNGIDPQDARVMWRIVLEVVDNKVELRKEMALWHMPGESRLVRVMTASEPLIFRSKRKIKITRDNGIRLTNNHIEFYDRPLHDQVFKHFHMKWDLVGISTADLAENLAIVAEVKLGPGVGSCPVFSYPQSTAEQQYVTFALNRMSPVDPFFQLAWGIEGEAYESQYRYRINGQGWHEVHVRQAGLLFEFAADTVPLGPAEITQSAGPTNASAKRPPSFTFTHESKVGYIGHIPGIDADAEGCEIRRLVFDPNDSCPTCGGRG